MNSFIKTDQICELSQEYESWYRQNVLGAFMASGCDQVYVTSVSSNCAFCNFMYNGKISNTGSTIPLQFIIGLKIPVQKFEPVQDIWDDWKHGIIQDTRRLFNPPPREPMYQSEHLNQEKRWEENAR